MLIIFQQFPIILNSLNCFLTWSHWSCRKVLYFWGFQSKMRNVNIHVSFYGNNGPIYVYWTFMMCFWLNAFHDVLKITYFCRFSIILVDSNNSLKMFCFLIIWFYLSVVTSCKWKKSSELHDWSSIQVCSLASCF